MAKKKRTTKAKSLVPAERIERSILLLRGEKVMLNRDLAKLDLRILHDAVHYLGDAELVRAFL